MRAHLERLTWMLLGLLLIASPASAQETSWEEPLAGFAKLLLGNGETRVLVVGPQTDAQSVALEKLVRDELRTSGLAKLVMDDSPLGDLTAKSDEEIFAASKAYPVDVIVILRTFPGADDLNAVVRIESKFNSAQSFSFEKGGAPPWAQRPPVTPVAPDADPALVAASAASDYGRQEAAMTSMGAIGVAETIRLISAEDKRRALTYDLDARSPLVRDPDGDRVPWPTAYEMMGEPDLGQRFRSRRVARVGLMASGGVLAAAGVGMLFVGLVNRANCSGSGGCGRPTLLIAGGSSFGVGAVGLLTGLLLRPHRVSTDTLQQMVEAYNASLAR